MSESTTTQKPVLAHTPGPWALEYFDHTEDFTIVSEHGRISVARISLQDPQEDGGRDSKLEQANAYLIAGAPDMLAELREGAANLRKIAERFVNKDRADLEIQVACMETIAAKAEGRT